MRPSDEKLRVMAHAAAQALEDHPSVRVHDRQGTLDVVRKAVAEVMSLHDEIGAVALAKLRSLSKPPHPGTREYGERLAQYTEEERRRRGL